MKEPAKKVVVKTAKPKVVVKTAKPKAVKVAAKPLKELKIAAKPKKKIAVKKALAKALKPPEFTLGDVMIDQVAPTPLAARIITPPEPAIPVPPPLVGKFRLPTVQEELFAFKQTVWDLNLHRTVTMNEKEIFKILVRYDHWVAAHSAHNGERTQASVDANVNNAFWEHIAQAAPK